MVNQELHFFNQGLNVLFQLLLLLLLIQIVIVLCVSNQDHAEPEDHLKELVVVESASVIVFVLALQLLKAGIYDFINIFSVEAGLNHKQIHLILCHVIFLVLSLGRVLDLADECFNQNIGFFLLLANLKPQLP